jgi:hypothetical protein
LGQLNHNEVEERQMVPVPGLFPGKYGILREMKGITLSEISSVKLMNRRDTKYLLAADKLPYLLLSIKDLYFILEIEGKRMASYETVYYDSDALDFFHHHMNGKFNRSKVRRRTYLDSNLHFLEVKRKTNKGKTIKTRIPLHDQPDNWSEEARNLINTQTGFDLNLLFPRLINRFDRITLVNTGMTERVTIDFNIRFMTIMKEKEVHQNNLVIIEIKQDKSSFSPIRKALAEQRFKKTGISKYCLGIALTGQAVKINRMKRKIREIQKITNHEYVA